MLVHCFAGKSRCATIAMAYLMLRKNCAFKTALEHCRDARAVVEPNLGFVAQLKALDRSLHRARFQHNASQEKGKGTSPGKLTSPVPKTAATTATETAPTPPTSVPSPTHPTINANVLPPSPPKLGSPPRPPTLETTHIVSSSSATPKGASAAHPPLPRSHSLSLSYDEFGHTTLSVTPNPIPPTLTELENTKKLTAERLKEHANNHRIATNACDRLYKRALVQDKKLTNLRSELPPDCTFSPKLNPKSEVHAAVAAARGKAGYEKMTQAQITATEESMAKAFLIQDRQQNNMRASR